MKTALLLAPVLLAACARSPKVNDPYQSALADARLADLVEVTDRLTPISQKNPSLTWRKGKVLMVNWNNRPEYRKFQGETMTTEREVWVTAAPELREMCKAFAGPKAVLPIRLKQLLGLPAEKQYAQMAELYVDPKDIFRPCRDPEIDDTTCSIEYPVNVTPEHKAWFEKELEQNRAQSGTYPWTGLGYTYDWGAPHAEYGLSEFVIRRGSKVEVFRVVATEDFCMK